MHLLEKELPILNITVMMQKETADRLFSPPGTRNCGAAGVAARFYSVPKILFFVSGNCFFPVPKVDSCVISFKIIKRDDVKNKNLFFKIVKSVFSQRRKNLLNSLSNKLEIDKNEILKQLKFLNINENLRAENLKFEDFIKISNNFYKFFIDN
jgi:16S rRNA (adenine1518-N6/adenine1519-N6)-dimethyltransferase